MRGRCNVSTTGDEFVFNEKGLGGPEVAGVVEGYGC
jgi:hypothetical protein